MDVADPDTLPHGKQSEVQCEGWVLFHVLAPMGVCVCLLLLQARKRQLVPWHPNPSKMYPGLFVPSWICAFYCIGLCHISTLERMLCDFVGPFVGTFMRRTCLGALETGVAPLTGGLIPRLNSRLNCYWFCFDYEWQTTPCMNTSTRIESGVLLGESALHLNVWWNWSSPYQLFLFKHNTSDAYSGNYARAGWWQFNCRAHG